MIWKYGVAHVAIFSTFYYFLGFFWSIVALIVLFQILHYAITPFGYRFAIGNDIVHMFDTDEVPHNCLLVLEMEEISYETLRDKGFYDIAICKIEKFRQIPVNILGFFFWKDIEKEIAKKQFQRCEADIQTHDQLLDYASKYIGTRMPLDRPQWEVKFVEKYRENRSVVMIKFQHCFTDGGGMLNALMFMNKPEHLPHEFKSARGIPMYMKLLASLLFPLRLLISVKELIPIRWEKRNLINTPTHDNTGVSKF